jgi:hypothetical protein
MSFTNLEKTDMVLIYDGEARQHSKLARQIYGKKLSQRILPNGRTFVNVVQHLRDFGRLEMNERDFDHQQEGRILVAEEDILHEIKESHFQQSKSLALISRGNSFSNSLATEAF